MTPPLPVLPASLVALAAPPSAGSSPLVTFVPFVLVLAIFYFIILLPMKKRQKKVDEFLGGLVDAALARWDRIDVLVNNAGIDDETPFLDMEEENWDAVIATNLKGPFVVSQLVAFRSEPSGIVTIISSLGWATHNT